MGYFIDVKISNKIVALVLCIALLLPCLTGCGDKDKDKDKGSTAKAKTSQTSGKSQSSSSSGTSSTAGKGTSSSSGGKVSSNNTAGKTTRRYTTKPPQTTPPPAANAPYAAPVIYPTVASGAIVYANEKATIDASNTSDGYVMIKYTGSIPKVKVLITKGTTYQYDLNVSGNYEVFPLTLGSGTYTVQVCEHVSGQDYSVAQSAEINVSLSSVFAPFLRPNQFVNYYARTSPVLKAADLCTGYSTDLQKLDRIYNFVINYLSYDYNKAETVQSGYLPDLNSVYAQRKGICFDYASMMTAMLRSQNIPCKLVIGWARSSPESIYHAWINVYIRNQGWINGAIYFDGNSWKLMDPTFASTGNSSKAIMDYINNTSNYSAVYYY